MRKWNFEINDCHAYVLNGGIGDQLLPNLRVRTIGTHQEVAVVRTTVTEICSRSSLWQHLISLEGNACPEKGSLLDETVSQVPPRYGELVSRGIRVPGEHLLATSLEKLDLFPPLRLLPDTEGEMCPNVALQLAFQHP